MQQVMEKIRVTRDAVVDIERQGLVITSIDIGKGHPVVFISPPDQDHIIRNFAQPFADLERVEVNRFGKLEHHIVWPNKQKKD